MIFIYIFEMFIDLLKNKSAFFMILLFLGYLSVFDAKADLYKFTDLEGHVYYSEKPKKGYKLIIRTRPSTAKYNDNIEYKIKEVDREIMSLHQKGRDLISANPENFSYQSSSDFIEKIKHEKNPVIKEAGFKKINEKQKNFINELREITEAILEKEDEKIYFQDLLSKQKIKKKR